MFQVKLLSEIAICYPFFSGFFATEKLCYVKPSRKKPIFSGVPFYIAGGTEKSAQDLEMN